MAGDGSQGVRTVRVLRSGVGDGAALASELGRAGWIASAEALKRSAAGEVLAGSCSAGQVVVKRRIILGWRERSRAALGATRLARQWRGAATLREAGIATAQPLVLWTGRDGAGRLVECLAMERVPGVTVLRCAATWGEVGRREELARAVGELTGRLLGAGLMNRDHKPSNLVVTPGERVELAVVDTVGIRRARPGAGVRMLANLVYELAGTGTLPDQAVMGEALQAAIDAAPRGSLPGFDTAWREVEALVGAHGDLTPRDDPLAGGV